MFTCSWVLCHTDPRLLAQRLAGRLALSSPEQRKTRIDLGEADEDFQRTVAERYSDLDKEGWLFDRKLDCTSTKQAVPRLLEELGATPWSLPEEAVSAGFDPAEADERGRVPRWARE